MKSCYVTLVGFVQCFALSNPPALEYSTYLGPASGATGIAIDPAGYAYVAGSAYDSRFPCSVVSSGLDTSVAPYGFITKLRPDGGASEWTLCFRAVPRGVALDRAGSLYTAFGEGGTAVLIKVSSGDGRQLAAVTIPFATASSLAIDREGSVYLAGTATAGFPATDGAYRSRLAENCYGPGATCKDGFVAKYRFDGRLEYATYTGTAGYVSQVAIDSRGAVWMTGSVELQGAGSSGFIAKLDANGAARPFYTIFGRGGLAFRNPTLGIGRGIAVDSRDAAYVVGTTPLAIATTPGTVSPGPAPAPPSSTREYVVKLDSEGNIVYATYTGGADPANSVAVDAAGNAYVGVSGSLTVLNADASQVLATREFPRPGQATPINSIALDGEGRAYVAGHSRAVVFLTSAHAYLTQYPGGSNCAFAAKFDFSRPAGPVVAQLVNAGSYAPGRNGFGPDGSVAPGEIVTLFGQGFRPGADLRVTFDGTAAPILFANSGQINAVVPFGLTPGTFTVVAVHDEAHSVDAFRLPVAAAAPGLFSIGETTQLAALNEDGTVNSVSNPAPAGSIVSVFLTGAGRYDRRIADGDIGPTIAPFPTPVLGVSATLRPYAEFPPGPAGPMQVLFAGQAPGLIAGLVQVNLRVPADAKSGKAHLSVYIGDYATGTGPRGFSFLEIR